MPESQEPAATCAGGRGQRRTSGAAAVQAVRHVPHAAVGPPRGGGGSEAGRRRGLHGVWPSAGPGFAAGIRVGAAGGRTAVPRPSAGPPTVAAGPAGGMAMGARLCGGPGAPGLGAAVGTGLRPGHLRRAGPGLRVPQQPGAASQAGPSTHPTGVVAAGAGTSAAAGGRPTAAPARRQDPAGGTLSVDVRLSGARGWLSQHGAHGAAGVRVPARHAAAHAAPPVALPGALDAPAVDPRGRPQGLFPCGVLAAPPWGRGPGAPVRDRARTAPEGSGCGPAAPATIGGRQAGAVPPVPCPPAAALRAVQASAARSGALLRAGAHGPPSGRGRGSGILAGPAGRAGAPGTTTGAASQAPLRGAGTGIGGPQPAAGLPLP